MSTVTITESGTRVHRYPEKEILAALAIIEQQIQEAKCRKRKQSKATKTPMTREETQ